MRQLLFFCALVCAPFWATASEKVITGTVLLHTKQVPDFKKITTELPANWYVRVDSNNISDKTAVFSAGGATVMLAYLDYALPPDEMTIASGISWLWKSADQEVKAHKGQLVVSVLGDDKNTLELYRIFTRVAACCLASVPDAPGLYMNNQYLLLQRGFYLESARNMGREGTPIYCWVYFGLLQQGEKSSGYTFGLTEFGHHELEIVESALPIQDSHNLLYDVALKALVMPAFKDGQQVELSEGRKVNIAVSPAQLIRDGSTTAKVSMVNTK
jgi:hypothetical protein